jgi:FMN phosphatase YigB (HAD superfamily)
MSDEQRPKVLFIDWYKTLSTSLFWANHPRALLSAQELSSISHFLFNQSGLIDLWMKGFTNSERIVAEIELALNIDAQKILKELEHSCKAMHLYDPSVPAIIQEIRASDIRVVLATDNMDAFERWTVPALKLESMFDGIITSVFRGALKSEIQDDYSPFFGHYLGQNGISAEDAILIDDSPIDKLVASIGLGFQYVNHPSQLASILREFLQQPT